METDPLKYQFNYYSKGSVMYREYDRKIVLEDGQEYYGFAFGDPSDKICEIVFNTSMVGYQEILSDPSYTDQAVVMTYPLIGNYGMAEEDYETETPTIGALIVREYNDSPSNFRSTKTLAEVMKKERIAGIEGIDTRKLTRSIRDFGSRKVLITGAQTDRKECLEKLKNTPLRTDQVSRVSRKKPICYPAAGPEGRILCSGTGEEFTGKYHIVAVDCGMKQNIVRSLNRRGCDVTVVPWNTKAEQIEALHPDGVFLSNGPGDPADVPETIETVRNIIGRYPIFGICLGHQILSLAYGANTYKLKFGHRGGNHPVKDLETGRIEVTSQNHSYAVDSGSVRSTRLQITHVNLLDGTVEGVKCDEDKVFSVQYHPESAPGPQDSSHLFERFLEMING